MKYVGTKWYRRMDGTTYRITKKNDNGTYAIYNITWGTKASQDIDISVIQRLLIQINICAPRKHLKKHELFG